MPASAPWSFCLCPFHPPAAPAPHEQCTTLRVPSKLVSSASGHSAAASARPARADRAIRGLLARVPHDREPDLARARAWHTMRAPTKCAAPRSERSPCSGPRVWRYQRTRPEIRRMHREREHPARQGYSTGCQHASRPVVYTTARAHVASVGGRTMALAERPRSRRTMPEQGMHNRGTAVDEGTEIGHAESPAHRRCVAAQVAPRPSAHWTRTWAGPRQSVCFASRGAQSQAQPRYVLEGPSRGQGARPWPWSAREPQRGAQ